MTYATWYLLLGVLVAEMMAAGQRSKKEPTTPAAYLLTLALWPALLILAFKRS